jgi:hypothetical protein
MANAYSHEGIFGLSRREVKEIADLRDFHAQKIVNLVELFNVLLLIERFKSDHFITKLFNPLASY